LAVNRRTYGPTDEKFADVLKEEGSANVTSPGPLILVHCVFIIPGGLGNPSSLALPLRRAPSSMDVTISGPAFTTGGAFPGGFATGAVISYIFPSIILGLSLLSIPRSTI
jgi:hypothetical protein